MGADSRLFHPFISYPRHFVSSFARYINSPTSVRGFGEPCCLGPYCAYIPLHHKHIHSHLSYYNPILPSSSYYHIISSPYSYSHIPPHVQRATPYCPQKSSRTSCATIITQKHKTRVDQSYTFAYSRRKPQHTDRVLPRFLEEKKSKTKTSAQLTYRSKRAESERKGKGKNHDYHPPLPLFPSRYSPPYCVHTTNSPPDSPRLFPFPSSSFNLHLSIILLVNAHLL